MGIRKITFVARTKFFSFHYTIIVTSVSDPYHFDLDPDLRIRIRDDGSGSGSEVTFDSVNRIFPF